MSVSAQDLMARGYLPAELPPIFSSASFLGCASPEKTRELEQIALKRKEEFELAPVNLARQGLLRRRLSIPHPIPQILLAALIEREQGALEAIWNAGNRRISQTRLEGRADGRAVKRGLSDEHLTQEYARVRATARFVVEADIAECYASIYTHALGWAIAGKDVCKRKLAGSSLTADESRNWSLADNLDKAIQKCQRRETHGLPIGPDTSLVLAETILSAADAVWVGKLPRDAAATRLVDDYRVGVRTRAEGEDTLAEIAAALDTFGLRLNPRKSRVVELPAPLDAPWVTALKGLLRDGDRPTSRQQRRDLLCVTDTAAAQAQANPEAHVYAYAVSLLRAVDVDPENWPFAQNLIFGIAAAEPGVLPRCLSELTWHHERRGLAIDRSRLEELLTDLIRRHARARHTSEVLWSLWGLRAFRLRLTCDLNDILSEMNDPLVWLFALVLEAEDTDQNPQLVERHEFRDRFEALMASDARFFNSSMWPVAYESVRSQLIDPRCAAAIALKKDPLFRFLAEGGATLLDPNATMDLTKKDTSIPGGYKPFNG
jgi:hypothetical protein